MCVRILFAWAEFAYWVVFVAAIRSERERVRSFMEWRAVVDLGTWASQIRDLEWTIFAVWLRRPARVGSLTESYIPAKGCHKSSSKQTLVFEAVELFSWRLEELLASMASHLDPLPLIPLGVSIFSWVMGNLSVKTRGEICKSSPFFSSNFLFMREESEGDRSSSQADCLLIDHPWSLLQGRSVSRRLPCNGR